MQINLSRIDPGAKATFWASLINPFMVVPGRHRLRVVMGLFIASIVELIGLAAIIPLLALVSFGPNTSAHMGTMKSAINDSFHAFLGLFGFSADITTLILLVVIGLSIKSAISILVMRYIGDLMADITTSVRLTIIRSLLGATWSFFSSRRVLSANAFSVLRRSSPFSCRSWSI
jgi:ATP-binding cassette, subfamily C, bacterial